MLAIRKIENSWKILVSEMTKNFYKVKCDCSFFPGLGEGVICYTDKGLMFLNEILILKDRDVLFVFEDGCQYKISELTIDDIIKVYEAILNNQYCFNNKTDEIENSILKECFL